MRFDHQKAFPYPVLRPDIDDYLDGEFQVTVDFVGDKDNTKLKAEVHIALSIREIREEIKKGNAHVSIVVACRDTYFRDAITTTKFDFTKTYDCGCFRGEVIIYPFVVATERIANFSCKDINPEFASKSFKFDVGEVLAADEPKVMYIDRELFRPISSIFQIVKLDSLAGFEWRASFEEDKIQILMSAEAKEAVDRARNDRSHRAVLLNSVYFATVMEAVQRLKDEEQTYADRRWAQIVLQQCHNAALNISAHDSSMIAQRLLKTPLALLNEYLFKEEAS
jgi:hypothetical protein